MKGNGSSAIREKDRAVPVYPEDVVAEDVARIEGAPTTRPAIETHIDLQPVAAPMILGLYALSAGVFMLGSTILGWFDGANNPLGLFTFIGLFAGLAQLMAAMWAYRARDGLGTIIHGAWGSLWLAFGVSDLLFAQGTLPAPISTLGEFGVWLLVASAITVMATVAAISRSVMLAITLGVLSVSSILGTIGYLLGDSGLATAGAIGFVATAVLAWYVGSSLLVNGSFGREVLPLGRFRAFRGYDVVRGYGEPGVTPYE